MSTMTSSETSTDSAEASGEDIGEFALIARMAARLKGGLPKGVVGIGDDCESISLDPEARVCVPFDLHSDPVNQNTQADLIAEKVGEGYSGTREAAGGGGCPSP